MKSPDTSGLFSFRLFFSGFLSACDQEAVAENCEAGSPFFALENDVFRHVDCRGKVPDGSDAACDPHVGHLLCGGNRDRQNSGLYMYSLGKRRLFLDIQDFSSMDGKGRLINPLQIKFSRGLSYGSHRATAWTEKQKAPRERDAF